MFIEVLQPSTLDKVSSNEDSRSPSSGFPQVVIQQDLPEPVTIILLQEDLKLFETLSRPLSQLSIRVEPQTMTAIAQTQPLPFATWQNVCAYLDDNKTRIAENPAPRLDYGTLHVSFGIIQIINQNYSSGLQSVTQGGANCDVMISTFAAGTSEDYKVYCTRVCGEYYTESLQYGLRTIHSNGNQNDSVKVKIPDIFKGKRTESEQFINQLALIFRA